MRFLDRADAGRRLAAALEPYAAERPIVLALPRGGVTVAAEVARALDAPLEAFIVRKLGAPFQPELGIGAIAEGDITYVDWASCMALDITTADVDQVIETERREVLRRVDRYRQGRPLPELTDRTVILVDDGVATGGTARAAIRAVRARGPRRLIFAVPVAAADTAEALRAEVDVLVAVHAPEQMAAIGLWYDDFHQVDDATVHEQLALVRRRHGEAAATSLLISVGAVRLGAELRIPPRATGLVLFAHGSGSSRFSPRNRFVADALARAGMATLLFDSLTEREEALDVETMSLRFDISLLAERLVGAIDWVASRPETRELGLGFFGSSTGAAAALIAAALRPSLCAAVVSRGGRPDLAQGALHGVAAPTLFIVGSEDFDILEINERALAELRCDKELVIIEGATHLFPEPGALQQVARVAADWFRRHLGARRVAAEARPGIRGANGSGGGEERRVRMLVHDCMSHRPETVDADDTLQMAAERMRVLDVGALPVVALGRLVGMITDRDIVVRGTARGHDGDTPVRVVMSPGAVTILAHDDVRDAVLQMARQSVRRLVVLDRELQIAGILSVDDLALQGCDPQLIAAVLARAVVRREEELGGPLP